MISYTRDSLIQAAILAGYAFFLTLAGFTVAQIRIDPVTAIVAAAVSAGGMFFAFLSGKLTPGPPSQVAP